MTTSDDQIAVDTLVNTIRPLLAGKLPEIQGAALADLTSLWLAGHHPTLREEVLKLHIEFIRQLVPVNENLIFGDAGFPERPQ
jgi:hypothetical protein